MTESTTRITVVHAPACHFCEDAEVTLSQLGGSYPVDVERVDIRSRRGQDLTRRHRPAMSPLVLVDDAFFSFGRLPRKKLVRLLEQRRSAAAQAG